MSPPTSSCGCPPPQRRVGDRLGVVINPHGSPLVKWACQGFRTCGRCRVKAQSRGFPTQVTGCETAVDLYVCCLLLSFAVPQVPPSCGPSAAHPGCEPPHRRTKQHSRFALELVFDTLGWWGPGTTRTWAGRSRRRQSGAPSCSASDLATIHQLAAKVEPYIRADGTRIWSLMQLARQLQPEAYGRRRGGYLDRRRTPATDA